MIKVNTEQLIAAAEQMTLQVNRLQEMEDQLQTIQTGLKESGTEFEKHISAVYRQRRKVQEERLTLKQMVSVLESAAEQYAECERRNLTRESTGTESSSGELKVLDSISINQIIVPHILPIIIPKIFPVLPGTNWKPKQVPRPSPKRDSRPGQDRKPGRNRRPGQDHAPERNRRSRMLGEAAARVVSQTKFTTIYNTSIFDLVK